MSKCLRSALVVAGISSALFAGPLRAETPTDFLAAFERDAQVSGMFQGFSAVRGQQFFQSKHGSDWSCSSCHTDSPAQPGKHAVTGKTIKPIAPAGNGERFTNARHVEKWFKRNCNDVLDRACTAAEKGDVLTYLLTVSN